MNSLRSAGRSYMADNVQSKLLLLRSVLADVEMVELVEVALRAVPPCALSNPYPPAQLTAS